jgi:hypothetical protein
MLVHKEAWKLGVIVNKQNRVHRRQTRRRDATRGQRNTEEPNSVDGGQEVEFSGSARRCDR